MLTALARGSWLNALAQFWPSGGSTMSQPWNAPEREATPEPFVSRRRWLKWLGLGGAVVGAGAGWLWWGFNGGSDDEVLVSGKSATVGDKLYPAATNPRFAEIDRHLTRESDAARWCNFYEFTSFKNVWRAVEQFKTLPWTVEVTGLVAKPRTYDLDDLVHAFPLEQRLYRHRCVEAWAMAVPWTGFPLAELLRKAEPLPAANFVRFVSFHRPEEATHQANETFP